MLGYCFNIPFSKKMQDRYERVSNEESDGGGRRAMYFPDKTRRKPAGERNRKEAIRRLEPGIGRGAGVIREGNWSIEQIKKNQNGFGIVFEREP
jgi:hypothetical protein